jgi:septal ring factor EnvC (AmiA/AmiB activator)
MFLQVGNLKGLYKQLESLEKKLKKTRGNDRKKFEDKIKKLNREIEIIEEQNENFFMK